MLRRLRVLGLARPSSALSSSMVPSVVRTEEVDEKRDDDANAPIVRVRTVDELGRAYGTGRRKTASARVWVFEGTGKITVNTKSLVDYFPGTHTATTSSPPSSSPTRPPSGRRPPRIARALQGFNPDLRPPLKKAGFLTRDRRRVERKKPGLVKPEKPQWVKR
ncbi:hypothetical protein CTAYLR_006878 [Chrysophaeum taylorii]|uniref:30S ribosomal protein S9, chloroplastic n=1 Tax=Chrysophaeum taylorii TaxID=2483200 RepID=A0AAD7UI04_9STRA|nr:hypothetical protein CTAYLR_006878 [Chrysophaeum taylorii]